MVLTYNDCLTKYGTDYQIKKEIREGRLFQKEKGIYSYDKYIEEEEIVSIKYPNAIYTGESAFYFHDLTDVIPDYHYLATKRDHTRIRDKRVKQTFLLDNIFELGKTSMEVNGSIISIYDTERMLIELIRFQKKIPYDYYKEIIGNYRKRIHKLDFGKIGEYASNFKSEKRFMDIISREVL